MASRWISKRVILPPEQANNIQGTTTGISASDRAKTCKAIGDSMVTSPEAFSRPGHILPLRAAEGGVLQRIGHTEAAVGKFPFLI